MDLLLLFFSSGPNQRLILCQSRGINRAPTRIALITEPTSVMIDIGSIIASSKVKVTCRRSTGDSSRYLRVLKGSYREIFNDLNSPMRLKIEANMSLKRT